MDKPEENRLTPFRSRTPSPELFDNNLSDFDDTEDEKTDDVVDVEDEKAKIHGPAKIQTFKSTDNVLTPSGIGHVKVKAQSKTIVKPNFMSRQSSRDAENLDPGETITKMDENATTDKSEFRHDDDTDINNKRNHVSEVTKEKQDIFDKRPTNIKQSLSTEAISSPPKQLSKEVDFNDRIGSWSLSEEDLIEKGHFSDPTIRIDPSLTESAREPASRHQKIRWPKFQKIPRAYHYRPSRNPKREQSSMMFKMMSKSPFTMLSTIAAQYNIKLTDLLEKYDETSFKERFAVRFPCMQCYEKLGSKAYGYESYDGTYDGYYDDYGSYESTDVDKCKKCGGKIQTMATFIKMIVGLKNKFESNNLVVHDVYPDGNCLFAAVVDQLRIRGVFEYTNQNLRQASVDYLRENPISSDGETHFELFLSDETWEDYLTRMSQDGEWGDHMVLSAIANITHQRILIFGGRSGSGQTIILPTDLQEPLPPNDPTKQTDDKDSPDDKDDVKEEKKTVSDETLDNDQSTDMQTELVTEADEDKQKANIKQKGEIVKVKKRKQTETDGDSDEETVDKEVKGDTGDEGKNETEAEENDWRDFDKTGTIFLGHFGESHYVSLRPKDWQDKLFSATKELTPERVEENEQKNHLAFETKIPLEHLDFFLKHLFHFKYLQSLHSDRIDFVHMKSETEFAREEGVGRVVNRLAPYFDQVKIVGPDIGIFMPVEKDEESCPRKFTEVTDDEIRTLLFIPKDTTVRLKKRNAMKFDLLAVNVEGYPDVIRLAPLRAEKWKGATVSFDGCDYLEAIEPKEQMLLAFQMDWPDQCKTWLQRHRSSKWPDTEIINKVVEEGCHVVPVLFAKNFDDFKEELLTLSDEQMVNHTLWTICFAIPERTISSSLNIAQLNVFYLFQRLLDLVCKDEHFPKSAYKHIFYLACENISQAAWKTTPTTCLLKLLNKMSDVLSIGELQHYFNPEINIFRNTPRHVLQACHDKIGFIRNQLMTFIYFLLNKHKITNSEIGFLFDEVIEDLYSFPIHKDIKRSMRQSLAAASLTLVSSCIYQAEYDFALNTFLYIREELKNEGIASVSNAELLTKGLPGEHLGYQWCFALYFDIKQGTKLTRELMRDLPSVPISDVFGPEAVALLPARVVPKQFAAHGLDIYFPTEVAKVLKTAGCTQAITTCICYYVETLFDYLYGSTSRPITMTSTYAYWLHKLLVTLYEGYEELGQRDEFKDLLPNFIKISQKAGKDTAYDAEDICIALGEEELFKKSKGKSSSSLQVLLQF